MLHDIIATAGSVESWTGLGIKFSPELAKALEVFEAVKYTETGHVPTFDLEKLTAANAEKVIRGLAEQHALATVHRDGSGNFSALDLAKRQVLTAVARKVNQLASTFIPEAIDQLTPEFDRQAKVYADAVLALPDEISSDTLVHGGAVVVTAYGQAQQAAAYLNAVSSWVASTADLGGGGDRATVLRILRPESASQLSKLTEAQGRNVNSALSALSPLLVTAVRLGVPFGINTLQEAAKLRESLRPKPQPLNV
ncbi:hypothetical protein [Mycobacterium avium]|uniref:hypothetical protein n=1 Tax=Mycobacterium avium TaxID=1764 RepID=UPI000A014337|nr:hypothetical protein [Mycobacterium avium]